MIPTRPRACEIEALAWATMAETPPPDLSGLLRRLVLAVLRPRSTARIQAKAAA